MGEFKPQRIVRDSVSKQVFFEIKKRISEGYWKQGEKLPSENELAEAFGVSRLSVRSALQSLEALKIVKIKNGDGTYVRKFELSNILDNISDMMTESVSMEDFNEYRFFFESACIRLIEKKDPDRQELDRLKECCEGMEHAAEESDYMSYNAWDLQFHQVLASLTGNKMFEYANSVFRSMYKHYYAINVANPDQEFLNWSKGIGYHWRFYEYLCNKEYDKALNALASVTNHMDA